MGTLREDLEASSESLSGEANDAGGTDTSHAVGSDGGNEVEAAAVSSVADAGEGGETSGTETPATAPVRDSTGKFAKATGTTTKAGQEVTPTPSTTGTTPPAAGGDSSKAEPPKPGEPDTTRAPASWRHAARMEWEKAPPAVRQEVARRELEMARAVTEFHPVKQFATEMQKTLEPIRESARARGTTPQRLVADYVNFDRQLSSRDPAAQAAAVAQVIKAYGVDIETLAQAIDNPGAQRQQQIDPVALRAQLREELLAEVRAERGQHEMSSHVRQVQEFASSKDADLFNDEIRHDMAALIDAAAARGLKLSLKDAYDRAVMANPDTRAIVQQREAAKRQSTTQVATQRAMAAGSSIKSRPASPTGSGDGKSLRDDLEAVASQLSGR